MSLMKMAIFSWLVLVVAGNMTEVASAEEGTPPLAVAPLEGTKARHHQFLWARHLKTDVHIKNGIGMRLVLIPPGEFLMGSPESESGRQAGEKVHRVRISHPFFLGMTEVTQGQWKQVMKSTPWEGKPHVQSGDDYPATYINWVDALAFCEKLNHQEQKQYALPTEAEWEYAARAGVAARFSFGDDESKLAEFAWFEKNANSTTERYAHKVGLKQDNPFGLYDMHGNVLEWCMDGFDEKYYARSPMLDPPGGRGAAGRVVRGGSWTSATSECRSAHRNQASQRFANFDIGFRVRLNTANQSENGAFIANDEEAAEKMRAPKKKSDAELRKLVVGTWNGSSAAGMKPDSPSLKGTPDNLPRTRATTTYKDNGQFESEFTFQFFDGTAVGHKYAGTWTVENGVLIHTFTSAAKSKMKGTSTKNRIIRLEEGLLQYSVDGRPFNLRRER